MSAVTPRITALPENLFAGLSKLQELRLQGNQISSLPAGVFAGLSELRQLTMQNNQLTALPEMCLPAWASCGFWRWAATAT